MSPEKKITQVENHDSTAMATVINKRFSQKFLRRNVKLNVM